MEQLNVNKMITTTKIRALLNDIESDRADKFGQAISELINDLYLKTVMPTDLMIIYINYIIRL